MELISLIQKLKQVSKSRTESATRIERARMIFEYSNGHTISFIARRLSTNRPKIEGCIDKALQLGALPILDDFPGQVNPEQ
ncbi:MAG: hypothetical protein SWO11_02410 [Thermodesulfobacteriota bacterium]|nr:hypothetical protein [Thermodesulfobacteriota bacterium]